jgi:hypothetical protein
MPRPLQRWHVGPWTSRRTPPGEPPQPGVRRTPDELDFDIIGLSRILGRKLSPPEELQVRRWQGELRPTDPRPCGIHLVTDPASARLLRETARQAFEWIADRAPAGYRFVLTDAVHLQPVPDLAGAVVAVEAVVEAALDRGTTLAAARLAAAQVHEDSTGGWVAGDAVCIWSGPGGRPRRRRTDHAARAELADQLRRAGHDDLAATAPRWTPVSVPSC